MIMSQIAYGEESPLFKEALQIRETVFTHEQGYDAAVDYDEYDKIAWHVVVYDEKQAIGTARLYGYPEQNCYKIGRVAVLKPYRGKNLGVMLMEALLDKAKSLKEFPEILLYAQEYAQDFYKKLGFIVEGEPFDEEGEPHIAMRCSV